MSSPAAMNEACESGKMLEITPGTPEPSSFGERKTVLFFWASWHDGCAPIAAILEALAAANSGSVLFLKVDAEAVESWSSKYDINAVPTIVLLSSNGVVVEKIEGGGEHDASNVTLAVQRLLERNDEEKDEKAVTTSGAPVDPKAVLTQRLESLIKRDAVMLFMKGNPTEPKCGFSRKAVEFLNGEHIPFSTFNILSDEEVRQGLKEHSNWPTYPQLYVNGELIGGLDIMKELAEESKEEGSESLAEQWGVTPTNAGPEVFSASPSEPAAESKGSLSERLDSLIKKETVMLFMKGDPSGPRCGFSRQAVEFLNEEDIPFGSFDILSDEEVRQGLKEHSNWPTYPQLYVKGELIGGLDIMKELAEESKEEGESLAEQWGVK